MAAVAYLRRSRVDTRRDGAISHEQQTVAIRALAERHGDDPDQLVWIEDWGKSGRSSKQHLRAGFARLEAMIKDGEVDSIYAYSANRLARSLETLTRLAKRCAGIDPDTNDPIVGAHLIPIRVHDGQSPDITDANGRLVFNILASVAEWQADWTQERMREATAVRRARGDHLGPAAYGFQVVEGKLVDRPGEDIDRVIAAYRDEGSFQGAARRLTLDGVPTRKGGAWQASTVHDMLQERAPGILPPVRRRGRRVSASFRLSGLLRCPHDEVPLTGRLYRGSWPSYHCRRAGTDPTHPYPRSIAEDKVLDWIKAEANLLRREPVELEGNEARRLQLDDDRRLVQEGLMKRVFTVEEAAAQVEAIEAELAKIETTDRLRYLRPPDWSWKPQRINTALALMWEYVELGRDLQPIRAEWRAPELRDDSAAEAAEAPLAD